MIKWRNQQPIHLTEKLRNTHSDTVWNVRVSTCTAGWLAFSDTIASRWLGSHVNMKGHSAPWAWRSWTSSGCEFTDAGSISTWKLVKYSSSLPIWPLCGHRAELKRRGEMEMVPGTSRCPTLLTQIFHFSPTPSGSGCRKSPVDREWCWAWGGGRGEDTPAWVLTRHAARHRGACPALPYITSWF